MTSLYNLISKCFVVSKHGIFITYPTNYDVIILQRFVSGGDQGNARCKSIWELFVVEVDRIRIKPSWLSKKKNTGCAYAALALVE